MVSTASVMFEPQEIGLLRDASAVGTLSYKRVVKKLQNIRNVNNSIKYAYILRPTNDPDTFKFIADADSLDPTAIVDLNGDGIIDDSDALNTPGDPYDVSDIPALRNQSLHYPATDDEPVSDQWGTFLSAYAPIKEKGEAAAVVGIDVEISDYLRVINQTLVPFVLFIAFLILLLSTLTLSLIKIWNSRVEVLRELDRQKDELIGIVAHQLGTPVTSVKWYIEMFLGGDIGKLTEEQQKQLRTMQGVTGTLADLVSMILDVSRLQLGKMKVDRTDLNLGEFFSEILAIIGPKAAEKKVKFTKSIPEKLPTAMLDKRLMRMTVENLLTNAVKYTPEGGEVELKVSVQGKMLKYVVRDTGCGIPKADQGRMFEKLFRASNVRKTDGNGFGLFVAKGAVEAQGGSIRFESTEGKGTTFFVEMPIEAPGTQKAT